MSEINQTHIDENDKIEENQDSPNTIIENLDDDLVIEDNKRDKNKMTKKQKKKFIIFALVAIVAGTLTGYGSAQLRSKNNLDEGNVAQIAGEVETIKAGDFFGVTDKDTFSDSAQGYLEKGGVNGEGSHRLLREGGDSQTISLTSSVTDLDDFAGMEIKVWGETNKAQVSGWFMDVGRVEVIEVEAESPIQTLD
jgi:hypothetical protein